MSGNWVSPYIQQDLYKPMIDFLNKLSKKYQVYPSASHVLDRLNAIGVSYCQPELNEERIEAMLHSIQADNLDIVEFINVLKEIKRKIEEKRNG